MLIRNHKEPLENVLLPSRYRQSDSEGRRSMKSLVPGVKAQPATPRMDPVVYESLRTQSQSLENSFSHGPSVQQNFSSLRPLPKKKLLNSKDITATKKVRSVKYRPLQ